MKQYFKVIRYEEALQLLKEALPPRRAVRLPLTACTGRRLSHAVISPESLPAFSRSSVDGYALKAEDTYGASEGLPAIIDLRVEILMGERAEVKLGPGQCAWIPTGGVLPHGCDAVVMVEHTEIVDETTVLIHRPVSPGENVMFTGEDTMKGKMLFAAGHTIRAVDIGILAALGLSELMVESPYRVGVISSGDELIAIEQKPEIGQVRDVNRYTITAELHNLGATVTTYPIIPDQREALNQVLHQACEENDLVFLSGGSSVGVKDMSLEVMLGLPDARLLFHGLAVKPGKPTLAVEAGGCLVLGLPGQPVSAQMIFMTVCAPVLGGSLRPMVQGQLAENVVSQAGRDDFVPVRLERSTDQIMVNPVLGKSGLIGILATADGYIHIPFQEQGKVAGSLVEVRLF